MVSLRRDPSVLPASLRHLTKRPRRYFFKTRLCNINTWTDRVQTAISTKTRIDNNRSTVDCYVSTRSTIRVNPI